MTKEQRDRKKAYDAKFNKKRDQVKKRVQDNKYNRDNGTYGNGDGKDASHKGGKITRLESVKSNRGRKGEGNRKKGKRS
jgi:hypothetical protein